MSISIGDLKLSAQCGLLGNVFPKLRAVCVNIDKNVIHVRFYIDQEISDDEKEFCESTLDEVIADFCNHTVDGEEIEFETPLIRLDYPQKPPLVGHWVYFRAEA